MALPYLYLLLAHFAPQNLTSDASTDVYGWYVIFLMQTFVFHAGLATLALGGVYLIRGQYRYLLVMLPAVFLMMAPSWRGVLSCDHNVALTPARAMGTADSTYNDDFTVMTANLLFLNNDYQPLLREIEASGADILVLLEYTSGWHEACAAELAARYPHVLADPAESAFGAAVYSRFPFVGSSTTDAGVGMGELSAPRITASIRGRNVTIIGVHLYPPYLSRLRFMRSQFQALLQDIDEVSGPLILAGDFNFTYGTAMYESILDRGLHNVYENAGCGPEGTWPNRGMLSYFPMIRIDHIFASGDFTPVACRHGIGAGSDHRPVTATLQWANQPHPSEPRPSEPRSSEPRP
jgi:endonuclease/exonuclease/phosphatase (EEP) superfamily protein YafD